jgi:hypothetical protein
LTIILTELSRVELGMIKCIFQIHCTEEIRGHIQSLVFGTKRVTSSKAMRSGGNAAEQVFSKEPILHDLTASQGGSKLIKDQIVYMCAFGNHMDPCNYPILHL